MSGLRYTYDARLKPGARLTSVTVNGKALDDKHTYTLATSDYVALQAGDGYEVFRGAKVLIGQNDGPLEADVLMKAIQSVPSIAPKVDGRITRVDEAQNKACNQR